MQPALHAQSQSRLLARSWGTLLLFELVFDMGPAVSPQQRYN